MADRKKLESLFNKYALDDYAWIEPKDVVVSQWVRMKCNYGCKGYGSNATCPPNVPSVQECVKLFSEYKEAVLFHFELIAEKPEDRHAWTKGINERLFSLEREVFLDGYFKAFVIYTDPCNICRECPPDKDDCNHPLRARPSPEALAVDVFTTARSHGYEIRVLTDYDEQMNRFAMLLIE